jgi:hypothetical protein
MNSRPVTIATGSVIIPTRVIISRDRSAQLTSMNALNCPLVFAAMFVGEFDARANVLNRPATVKPFDAIPGEAIGRAGLSEAVEHTVLMLLLASSR